MNQLTSKTCVACRMGAPLATEEEINEFMLQLPNWEIVTVDQVKQLKRFFLFNSFSDAVAFTQKVATLADDENHHPAILTEWGKVTVFWWSHKIKGLHVNDFIMAAKTDKLGNLYG
ncbi:MAG: 4a-hydroxytetrahydrobiopterin dehydratase [Methylomarinum sp.]|nr:4a-hydroxytetrahydrobiopterin dehydratase [Methylomarinum sp.]